MSKQCNSCGTVVEDEVVFCTNCGNMISETPAEETSAPEVEAPEVEVPAKNNPVGGILEKVKKEPKLLMIGAVAIVAVVLVIVLIASLAGGGYKTAVKNYEAVLNGKVNKYEKIAPEAYWEWVEDEYDQDMDDLKDDFEDEYEETIKDLDDDYGDNVKFDLKILKKEALKDSKLKKIAKALDAAYEIDKDDVKKAYTVKCKYTVKGKEDYDYTTDDLTVVKIGSKWYVINAYEYDGEYEVYFMD